MNARVTVTVELIDHDGRTGRPVIIASATAADEVTVPVVTHDLDAMDGAIRRATGDAGMAAFDAARAGAITTHRVRAATVDAR